MTEAEFELRKSDALSSAHNAAAREWFRNSIRPDGELAVHYRLQGCKIETEIERWLDKFQPEPAYPIEYSKHDLRVLRRFLLQRYSFILVFKMDRSLVHEKWTNAFGLIKEYLVARIAFALLIGYGIVLGAGGTSDWLGQIGNHSKARVVVLLVLASLVWSLIYLNVRDQIGSRSKGLNSRTAILFVASAVWTLLGSSAIFKLADFLSLQTSGWQTLLVSALALLAGFLTQFFFSKGGSFAAPL